jgi:predicted ATPase
MTEVVGREEELESLLRRWSKAKAGEGQVVLLSGEAGIGSLD